MTREEGGGRKEVHSEFSMTLLVRSKSTRVALLSMLHLLAWMAANRPL